MLLEAHEIAGGIVRRGGLQFGNRHLRVGDRLTGDQIRSMPRSNQVAWMDSRAIEVWPRSYGEASDPSGPVERHVVHLGRGHFNVIEGRVINDGVLSKDEAEDLAHKS